MNKSRKNLSYFCEIHSHTTYGYKNCDLCVSKEVNEALEKYLADTPAASDEFKWDEYDGEVIDGIRYANSFTANMAKNSRLIGAKEERERIIAYLKDKGVLRDAMFYPGLVGKAEFIGDDKMFYWHTIDLPLDLGAGPTQKGGN